MEDYGNRELLHERMPRIELIQPQFNGTRWKFDHAKGIIHRIVDGIIQDRTTAVTLINPGEQRDYLSMLIASQEGDDELTNIRELLVVLLFAGRESMQNTFSWMMYEIMRHPEWISLLRQEADRLSTESDPLIPPYAALQVSRSLSGVVNRQY